MRLLALLSLVLASLHAPASSFAGADTSVGRRAGLEAEVVREVNRVRVEHGLRPLRAAPSLRTAARTHSRSMLAAGVFGHDSPDGTSFNKRIRRFYGDRGWQTWSVGEALLASSGQDITASAIVSAWLDSPSHREVVLASSWRDVGVGAFRAPAAPGVFGGLETLVVTADFGLREGRSRAGDRSATVRLRGERLDRRALWIDLRGEPSIPAHDDEPPTIDLVDDATVASAQTGVVGRRRDELDPRPHGDSRSDPRGE